MHEPNHPTPPSPDYHRDLADGGTISLTGATAPDPDTGAAVPAATLHLPAWRLRDLATALRAWSTTTALFAMTADWPPDETDLANALTTTADLLDPAHSPHHSPEPPLT